MKTFLLTLLLAAVVFMAATPSAHGLTYIRVAHLISDFAGNTGVDVYVNGTILLTNFTYPTVTDYNAIPAGPYFLRVTLTGQTGTLISAVATLADDVYYTAAAVGSISNATAYPLALSLQTDTLSLTASTEVRIAFFHGSAGAPNVDVKTGSTTLFGNRTYNSALTSITVAGGSYPVQVFVAGTTTEVLNLGSVNFPAGSVVTVFAIGDFVGGQSVSVTTKSATTTSTFTSSGASSLELPWSYLW